MKRLLFLALALIGYCVCAPSQAQTYPVGVSSDGVTVGHCAKWVTGNILGDVVCGGGSMVYPGAGIANSTGSAWGTSYTTSGSGTVICLTVSCVMTTPNIGAATATSINGNTFTTGTFTLTGGAGKTFTFNNTLTFTGTDATTMTLPGTSQTLAGLGAAETWTAAQKYTNSDILLLGSSTGYTTFTSANASATNYTLTFPAATAFLAYQSGTWTAGDCAELASTTGAIEDSGAACGAGSGNMNDGSGTTTANEIPVTTTTAHVYGLITPSSATIADLKASTTFTVAGTGCTPSAHAGGPFSGTITLASGPCTAVTVTINGATSFTAPTGFQCWMQDGTLIHAGTFIPNWSNDPISSTTATAVFPIPTAAQTSGDVMVFSCSYG